MKTLFKKISRKLLISFSLLIVSCTAQENKLPRDEKEVFNKPDVRINVNKKTDKNGRIISYDSSYSYSYHSGGVPDSLWTQMNNWFGHDFGFSSRRSPFLFRNDSAFFENSDPLFREFERLRREMTKPFEHNFFYSPLPQLYEQKQGQLYLQEQKNKDGKPSKVI